MKLTNTTLPPNAKTQVTFVEDPEDPDFCPVRATREFRDKCHPHAKKFYGSIASEAQREAYMKEFGKEIWFNPSDPDTKNKGLNLGHNMVAKHLKDLAKLCGLEGWRKCTGHALRALMITVALNNNLSAATIAGGARHTSLNAQTHYQEKEGPQETNRQLAINLNGKKRVQPKKKSKKTAPVEVKPKLEDIKPVASLPPLTSASLPVVSGQVVDLSVGSPATMAAINRLEARKRKLQLEQEVARLEGARTPFPPPPYQAQMPFTRAPEQYSHRYPHHHMGHQQHHRGGITPPYYPMYSPHHPMPPHHQQQMPGYQGHYDNRRPPTPQYPPPGPYHQPYHGHGNNHQF